MSAAATRNESPTIRIRVRFDVLRMYMALGGHRDASDAEIEQFLTDSCLIAANGLWLASEKTLAALWPTSYEIVEQAALPSALETQRIRTNCSCEIPSSTRRASISRKNLAPSE